MMNDARKSGVPVFVHLLNLLALVVLAAILVLSTVIQAYHLIVLLPILGLGVFYWRLRSTPAVAACYLSLSLAVGLWIVICENIVTVDNLFKTRITSKLDLGAKLLVYASDNLATASKTRLRQSCCNDPMSYHLRPGSIHRETYDCDTCNEAYSVVVDETGYLNLRRGLYDSNPSIDLFLAGDSLMQGIGMPSALEFLRDRVPMKMWNLSTSGYGPRQKIDALLTYALPKNPKWLIVDFYSANDPMDTLDDEVCESSKDFRCKFSKAEVRRRLLQHPVYRSFVVAPDYAFASFEHYAENYWTVAVNRYLMNAAKGAIKEFFHGGSPSQSQAGAVATRLKATDVAHPSETNIPLRPGHLLGWSKAGLELTHKHYQRLVAKLRESEAKPYVILLYTPSAYEVYRDILLERDPEYDQVSDLQVEAQRLFATRHGWSFLDLTEPIRKAVSPGKTWIYGQYDRSHWSSVGTAVVAGVMAEEILRLL
jgi:hypothetical protein